MVPFFLFGRRKQNPEQRILQSKTAHMKGANALALVLNPRNLSDWTVTPKCKLTNQLPAGIHVFVFNKQPVHSIAIL